MAPDEQATPEADCTATRGRIAAFLGGRLERDSANELRAHRKQCARCDDEWRASIDAASQLRRRGRVSDEQEAREQRREHNRRLALEGAFAASGQPNRRVRRARRRLLLMPALAILLMAVIYPMSRRSSARLEALEGEVELSYRTLTADEQGASLKRGDWISTGPDVRARLTVGDAEVEIEPGSRVLLEDANQGRLRLIAGALGVSGDCVVTSDLGVVQVEGGAGRIRMLPRGLEVQNLKGSLVTANSGGEEVVRPGERTLLAVR